MQKISERTLGRNEEESLPETNRAARAAVLAHARALIALALAQASEGATFEGFEKGVFGHVLALARAVVLLFLVASEERVRRGLTTRVVREGRTFRAAPVQERNLLTWFGVVRYTRTYLREIVKPGQAARGYHPLDAELGLLADRISPNVLSVATRLSTRTSYAEAHDVLAWFLPVAPSTEVIEAAVLGYGAKTQEWFEEAPAPEDDGEVLVVQCDSKGVPTATDEELRKRRGKRGRRKKAPSPRHRGRLARGRRTKKPRRAKGDKAKNAKMGTMVVMYTLRRQPGGRLLLGPLNKWYYASFAPKRHAVEIARREATKRGFPPGTTRVVQVVTDGDNDLARYFAELFPDATRTIDVIHVVEKLWDAGSSVHREGSEEHHAWVERQKDALYAGRAAAIVAELDQQLASISRTGPGNKFRREKLTDIRGYIEKRVKHMTYDALRRQDLELGTGAVEGAIKNLMGRRMDHGGMRWIKERAEALLQLRCIDANGDWEAFVGRVHAAMRQAAVTQGTRPRLQQRVASPLPNMAEAA
jgi:hypothetical protein